MEASWTFNPDPFPEPPYIDPADFGPRCPNHPERPTVRYGLCDECAVKADAWRLDYYEGLAA